MAIFFVRLIADDNSARSVAFSCEYPSVATLTRALREEDIVAGFRCEWRWDDDHTARIIVSRSGLTISSDLVTGIEEPHVRFAEEEPWNDRIGAQVVERR
jgi:hypothetical protein